MAAEELDLDALLESALDDFNADPDPPAPRRAPEPAAPQRAPPTSSNPDADAKLEDLMADPMNALTDLLSDPAMKADFERDFGTMMNQMGMDQGEESFSLDKLQQELEKQMNQEPSPAAAGPAPPPSDNVEDDLSATLQNLMNSAKDLQQVN